MVRLAPTPVTGHGDRYDVLVALDWHNASRFIAEVPLDDKSLILADANGVTRRPRSWRRVLT